MKFSPCGCGCTETKDLHEHNLRSLDELREMLRPKETPLNSKNPKECQVEAEPKCKGKVVAIQDTESGRIVMFDDGTYQVVGSEKSDTPKEPAPEEPAPKEPTESDLAGRVEELEKFVEVLRSNFVDVSDFGGELSFKAFSSTLNFDEPSPGVGD